jgi:hypothetical protein
MNLILKRTQYRAEGIFSELMDDRGELIAVTLEHSYSNTPKIPPGVYRCLRSLHRLHGMTQDFETFEVTGVEGHRGLLFHWGNFNRDSDGCILLGDRQVEDMVTHSRDSFQMFMQLQAGLGSFLLTVVA